VTRVLHFSYLFRNTYVALTFFSLYLVKIFSAHGIALTIDLDLLSHFFFVLYLDLVFIFWPLIFDSSWLTFLICFGIYFMGLLYFPALNHEFRRLTMVDLGRF